MTEILSCKDLGKLIQDSRKSQNFTQKQLAAICGVGERFIVDLEKGKPTCSINKALKIAQSLGIKIIAK
ncbi:MAG: transcriptional regulator [Proteobacteria bacterium]|nr:transcriptional regulator [Pseudomonadota bacterium]